jgi:predicted  nucleic acid-binding Zn-ribbon protein
MQAPQLKRGLFGYTSKSVHLILADREARTSEQARATEAVVLGLRSGAEILKRQRAEQAEKLRALEAEAAALRADRNATRGDLEHAVADATRLGLELTATKGELETVRRDLETTRHEIETARDELDRQERRQAAEEMGGTPSGEIDVLRKELGSARRYFLIQSHRATRAEDRIEELEAELRSVRAELDGGISAATSELEAAHAAVEEAAARRPVPISSPGAEEPSAVLEVAGRTMARIMDGARTRATEELREAERTRRETLAEIERLAAWRDRLAPLVGVVQSTIEDAKERAGVIGHRVDEAVEPLTQAIAALGDRVAALAELAALPDEADREPATERSLLIELDEEEQAPGQRVPAWGNWS